MVIGLDGATYDLILPWVKAGELPVFGRLLEESAWGPLESTRPPLTCPAWPVFYTGRNPGKLGAIDFISGNGGDRIVSYGDIRGLAFWDLAARGGLRSVVINVPVTYPPRIVNGLMLSGMLTPPDRPFYTSREVMDEIETQVGEYLVDLDIVTLGSFDRRRSLNRFYHMMEQRHKTAMYLKKTQPHDIMVVVFQGPDIVSHRLWNQKEDVLDVYRLMDRYVGELAHDVESLLIMSDHGFAGYEKGVRVNQFLFERGDLAREKADHPVDFTHGSSAILKHRFGSANDPGLGRINWLRKWFWRLGIDRNLIKGILGERWALEALRRGAPSILKKLIPPERFVVDREESTAFLHATRTRSICINAHRIPPGVSYEVYKQRLIEDLLSMTDEESGIHVFSRIYHRDELYHGPYVEQFPDLFLETAPSYLVRGDFGSSVIGTFSAPKSAHDQKGIFLWRGSKIKPGSCSESIRLVDLAPTILYLLGIPIPREMDGHVCGSIMENHEIGLEAYADETESDRQGIGDWMSHGDEREVIDKLRALGYMD
jgi:predicted AlkP superfamily phosphohydrolase/phosphomutase